MSKILKQFKNYLEIANANMRNQNLYFFIKNYAFNKAYNTIKHDSQVITDSDRKTLDYLLEDFTKEKQLFGFNVNLTKDEYQSFLENYYGTIDFDNASVDIIETCKDLTEVIYVFGQADDLTNRRMDYFNKKVQLLQPKEYIDSYKNLNTNVLSEFQPKIEKLIPVGPSKSLDELPDVKDEGGNFSYKKMESVEIDYIPTLVDKSIRLPISKTSSEYSKVKELIKTHIEYSTLELDFHKLDNAKDHVEAAIYYLRNIH